MAQYRFSEFGQYKIGKALTAFRPQFPVIISWVKEGANVLDVGCGDGVLGQRLIKERRCRVHGIDLDEIGVAEAKRRGIQARVFDADDGLPFKAHSFDVVVCNELLEFVRNPNFVISECLRVGSTAIIEFPNFGFWFYRLQMLAGRFPTLALYGYSVWETRQTKFFTYADALRFPALKKARVTRRVGIDWKNRNISLLATRLPNLFARSVIMEIRT